MVCGHVITSTLCQSNDDGRGIGWLDGLRIDDLREVIADDRVSTTANVKEPITIVQSVADSQKWRPRLKVSQKVIRRHEVLRTILRKDHHPRIKGVEPVVCHAGSSHSSQVDAARATREDVIGGD